MIRLRQALVVEGRYDQIRLDSVLQATVVRTNGFRIFKDKETLQLIRTLAVKTGVVILTDSDAAGFKIRRFLAGAIREGEVVHAYIPDLPGKEPRKAKPSKEGTLGVEGVSGEQILAALRQAGVLFTQEEPGGQPITKLDLFADKLTGGEGSALRRAALKQALGLPAHLTTNALLTLLNTMLTYGQYKALVESLPPGREDVLPPASQR